MKNIIVNLLPNSDNPVKILDELNFSLLQSMKGVKQNKYHVDDLYTHSVKAYQIVREYVWNPLVHFATLMHDVGKVTNKQWKEEKQDYTFHKHEIDGAIQVKQWMIHQKFNKQEISLVYLLIRYHQFRFHEGLNYVKSVKKWLHNLGSIDNYKYIFNLRLADRMANGNNKGKAIIERHLTSLDNTVQDILDQPVKLNLSWEERKQLIGNKKISGDDLELACQYFINTTYEGNNNKETLKEFICNYLR